MTAEVGQSFNINVTVYGVTDLYGWEFKLGWNTSLLDATGVVEGPFLKTGGETFFHYMQNSTVAYLMIDCTLVGLVPGVGGQGILATITLYVEAAGQCSLDLYDTILLDSLERPIPCQNVDGYGYFTSFSHDIAIMGVFPSPLIAIQGDMVIVNVTAQNQGDFTETFSIPTYAGSETIGLSNATLCSGFSITIQVLWNTTGSQDGDYTIMASASIVPGEVDTADNARVADEKLTILCPGHNVALIDVKPAKTIVGQDYSTRINATAKNYGTFRENFNVTVYANMTVIGTQENVSMASGESITIVFPWDTTGAAKGNYDISAYAEPVPDEARIQDNTHTGGIVSIVIPGDVNGDRYVGVDDIFFISSHFGLGERDPSWEPNCDIANDGYVGVDDIFIAALNFGQETP